MPLPAAPPDRPAGTLPHRLWRHLPATVRRQALAHATAFLAPKPDAARRGQGLIVAGEFSRASGLGETARLMAAAASRSGIRTATIDIPSLPARRLRLADPLPEGAPLVLHVNAPMLPLALLRLPRAAARNRPVVGYWAWELPDIAPEWRPALGCVNAVWVPSRFTAAALEPLLPGRVRVVPPPLDPAPAAPDRARFGLPAGAVVVLVSVSIASSFARKHPFAAVAAFRGAFGDRPDRILLLKVGGADHAPADFARLAGMARAANIRLLTGTLTAEANRCLTACADIVLSLHRAEGFGLVLAEAMLLGKPVVATGWSGNTDFMDEGSAALVRYRLVPARDDRAVYRGVWAEPDVADAADKLRALADDPALRRTIGAQAQRRIRRHLAADALARALEAIP